MASARPRLYEHSGIVPPAGLGIAVAGSLVGGAVLGWLYTEFICRIPIIYFNFLATLVFGYGAGAIASRFARLGKLRHKGLPGVLAVAAAALGLYFAWSRDIMVRGLIEEPFFTLSPGLIWDYVQFFNENGGWSIDDTVPTGAALWAVWFMESVFVFGAAWAGSKDALETDIFCEPCDGWTQLDREVKAFSLDAFEALKEKIRAGEVEPLATARVVDPGGKHYVRVDLSTCPTCTESNYAQLTAVTVIRDGKGVERKRERALSKPIRVPGVIALKFPHGTPAWKQAGLMPEDYVPEPRRPKDSRKARRPSAKADGKIEFTCPSCGCQGRLPAKYAGKKGRCPDCKESVRVPDDV